MTEFNPQGHSRSTNDAGNEILVKRCHTMAGFALEAGLKPGIAIQSLLPGTTLIVRTRNSKYRLTVTNTEPYGVQVRGGVPFPEATLARLQGATAGGSLVKIGWIEVGLRMELWVGSRRFITSPVRSFRVRSRPPRPPHVQQAGVSRT